MGVSARILGQQYGLTAAEMNRVLVKKGILAGNPGDYYLTELGDLYGATKHFHRGCGGSARYNRYWSERTYGPYLLGKLTNRCSAVGISPQPVGN